MVSTLTLTRKNWPSKRIFCKYNFLYLGGIDYNFKYA